MIRSLLFSSALVPIFRTTRTSPSNFLGFHCLPFSATARFTLVSVLHCPGSDFHICVLVSRFSDVNGPENLRCFINGSWVLRKLWLLCRSWRFWYIDY